MKSTFTKRALEDLRALDKVSQKQILKKLNFYIQSDNPFIYARKLVNSDDGQYQLRVGTYRIVFDANKSNITILRIQHRREVYRYKK